MDQALYTTDWAGIAERMAPFVVIILLIIVSRRPPSNGDGDAIWTIRRTKRKE